MLKNEDMETQRGNNELQSDDKQTQNSQKEERIICIETENVQKEKQHDRDHMTDILTSSTGLMWVCLSVCRRLPSHNPAMTTRPDMTWAPCVTSGRVSQVSLKLSSPLRWHCHALAAFMFTVKLQSVTPHIIPAADLLSCTLIGAEMWACCLKHWSETVLKSCRDSLCSPTVTFSDRTEHVALKRSFGGFLCFKRRADDVKLKP